MSKRCIFTLPAIYAASRLGHADAPVLIALTVLCCVFACLPYFSRVGHSTPAAD